MYQQGELGHWFFVVDSGEFDVVVKEAKTGGESKVVHTYKGGKHLSSHATFGEQALMYGKPRGATVMAKTPGVVWGLHRQAFQAAVKQFQVEKQMVLQPSVSQRIQSGAITN